MATCVTPDASSQSASSRSPRVVVAKRRTSWLSLLRSSARASRRLRHTSGGGDEGYSIDGVAGLDVHKDEVVACVRLACVLEGPPAKLSNGLARTKAEPTSVPKRRNYFFRFVHQGAC